MDFYEKGFRDFGLLTSQKMSLEQELANLERRIASMELKTTSILDKYERDVNFVDYGQSIDAAVRNLEKAVHLLEDLKVLSDHLNKTLPALIDIGRKSVNMFHSIHEKPQNSELFIVWSRELLEGLRSLKTR